MNGKRIKPARKQAGDGSDDDARENTGEQSLDLTQLKVVKLRCKKHRALHDQDSKNALRKHGSGIM